ncbi:O-linked N-acetylglucosamine transferase, SPINDLY family protein [Microseira wollei]|uniref:TPR repeat-containing protein n=1 Tax=Microseira wollei NIES-4236 TaxID=2530354 RepID=A0AAV3WLK6_9CYAN|nr:O-linked N-acetylglucosamine transferase, SPINDLY family protein [Microseira wollei]GET41949.1 TPR repeat-containing protein [Microseira wollei NIES-4236]
MTYKFDPWHQQIHHYLLQDSYTKAAELCEQAIAAEPNVKSYYWHLGLMLLLQGQEAEAHTTWLLAMAEGEAEQVEHWTAELVQVLQFEAQRQEELADYAIAWAIRQHLREIKPTEINNLLHLIGLAIQLETFNSEDLISLGIIELLQWKQLLQVDCELMMQVLKKVLSCTPENPSSLEFAEACLWHLQQLTDFPKVLQQLAVCYENVGDYSKAVETAKRYYFQVQKLPDKIFANYLILRMFMRAGAYWEEAFSLLVRQESLLGLLIAENSKSLDEISTIRLFPSTFFLPYFRDDPRSNRSIQNQISQMCQAGVQTYGQESVQRYSQRRVSSKEQNESTKRLKIGYLSYGLRRHSVGWLARWLFQYHNRDRFTIHAYFLDCQPSNDPLQEWYVNQVDKAYKAENDSFQVAEEIYQDEIDILVELDSITLDVSCEIVALKPAPVQVTWLGWDASGIPAIDYFIADPYVLPESAQNYYTENIWRLPQTYIAVDGFEVGVPTLRRDELNIPSDAVVYLSAQRGFKQHPNTIQLQMKILKEVPNSYFLIKGTADEESQKDFFVQVAEAEGVSSDRLRFIPEVASEAVHRANLGIADVVLDTYPYNGATTTLETLWMGIPLVTRVGEQFSSRNSYTMMMNVGVTEGIAWTDEEYVEWGIRLGKDPVLRQQIAWRLRSSRQTSPLWNAKQFTREMEKAYEQMWLNYLEADR